MAERSNTVEAPLYLADETAWLERMAGLLAEGRLAELDLEHLGEYLTDMARRDRREVLSRLVVLMAHLLTWDRQPERRSSSWRATIALQRDELGDLLESETLLRHARDVIDAAYVRAVKQAAIETGLAPDRFPIDCPFAVESLLIASTPDGP